MSLLQMCKVRIRECDGHEGAFNPTMLQLCVPRLLAGDHVTMSVQAMGKLAGLTGQSKRSCLILPRASLLAGACRISRPRRRRGQQRDEGSSWL